MYVCGETCFVVLSPLVLKWRVKEGRNAERCCCVGVFCWGFVSRPDPGGQTNKSWKYFFCEACVCLSNHKSRLDELLWVDSAVLL